MISPIHPSLQGIAAERFFALGQELMRRQRSNQCDRLTELSEREASWADHQAGMNGDRERYKACARVLIDLAKARWRVAEDRFGIELQSPDARLQHALSPQEIEQGKSRVRTELQPLLNQQFDSPSVRKFIAQMEQTGAEMLFEIFSQRYERAATMVTSNLPFNEWTEILGSERLTGALLDRLTHHVHILEMNGESYRLKESKLKKSGKPRP